MSDYKEIYAGEGNKSFYPILNKGVREFFLFVRTFSTILLTWLTSVVR